MLPSKGVMLLKRFFFRLECHLNICYEVFRYIEEVNFYYWVGSLFCIFGVLEAKYCSKQAKISPKTAFLTILKAKFGRVPGQKICVFFYGPKQLTRISENLKEAILKLGWR